MGRKQHGLFVMSEAELRALPTPRLLAYKNRVLLLHETCWCDFDGDHSPDLMHTKSDYRYSEYLGLVTHLLAEREHVPRQTSCTCAARGRTCPHRTPFGEICSAFVDGVRCDEREHRGDCPRSARLLKKARKP